MTSPTARTLAALRKEGWTAQVVEKWNAHAKVRVDLYGIIDILAMRNGKLLGVQATSGSNAAARVKKARAEPRLAEWLACGCAFEVHGWRKVKVKRGGKATKWEVRRILVL